MSEVYVLLDRDGVLNVDRPDSVKSVAELEVLPRAAQAVALLNARGYQVLLITNQSIVGRGQITPGVLEQIHAHLFDELGRAGGRVADVFVCPHAPGEGCDCRKPLPGLLLQAAERYGLVLAEHDFVGDSATDIAAARHAGARPVLVLSGKIKDAQDHPGVAVYSDLYDYALSKPDLGG